ncbi:hypothetical protein BC828DRAFT_376160 [Blastocladiella britannica]|nr:hypothetical protein BC828DRAFT_376160 [Blastocladiella britannica]
MRSVVVSAARLGHVAVLQWFRDRPLQHRRFTDTVLTRSARPAVMAASRNGHVAVCEWYQAQLLALDPSYSWSLRPAHRRQIIRCGYLPVVEWWLRVQVTSVRHWFPYELAELLTRKGAAEVLAWLLGCGALVLGIVDKLRLTLVAPDLDMFWFWVQRCEVHPASDMGEGAVLGKGMAPTNQVARLKYVWSVAERRGWAQRELIRKVMEGRIKQQSSWDVFG